MTWFILKGFDVLSDFYLRHQAQRRYNEWLSAHQVIIAEVLRTHGDRTIDHPTRKLA